MPNLRCTTDKNQCQPLLQLGETGITCTDSNECVLGAGCHKGTCIEIMSLPNGTVLEECTEDQNFLCQSMMCKSSGGWSSEYECAPAHALNGQAPYPCGSNDDCESSDGITGTCECGKNEAGQSYCLPMNGDPEAIAYFTALKKFLQGTPAILLCHSDRRYMMSCFLAAEDIKLAQQ